MTRVYLDNNATTPLDPRVRAAMLRWLGERWGNPSSIHAHGQEAREAIEEGRARVATLLGARPEEIVFVYGLSKPVATGFGSPAVTRFCKFSRQAISRPT